MIVRALDLGEKAISIALHYNTICTTDTHDKQNFEGILILVSLPLQILWGLVPRTRGIDATVSDDCPVRLRQDVRAVVVYRNCADISVALTYYRGKPQTVFAYVGFIFLCVF